jgi:hypothetical protein
MSRPYPAGRAHYRGDRRNAVGQVMGPTSFGTLVRADSATYDPETNTTTVEFVTLTADEVLEITG